MEVKHIFGQDNYPQGTTRALANVLDKNLERMQQNVKSLKAPLGDINLGSASFTRHGDFPKKQAFRTLHAISGEPQHEGPTEEQ